MSVLGALAAVLTRGRRVPRTGFTRLTTKQGPRGYYKGKGAAATGKHTSKGARVVEGGRSGGGHCALRAGAGRALCAAGGGVRASRGLARRYGPCPQRLPPHARMLPAGGYTQLERKQPQYVVPELAGFAVSAACRRHACLWAPRPLTTPALLGHAAEALHRHRGAEAQGPVTAQLPAPAFDCDPRCMPPQQPCPPCPSPLSILALLSAPSPAHCPTLSAVRH